MLLLKILSFFLYYSLSTQGDFSQEGILIPYHWYTWLTAHQAHVFVQVTDCGLFSYGLKAVTVCYILDLSVTCIKLPGVLWVKAVLCQLVVVKVLAAVCEDALRSLAQPSVMTQSPSVQRYPYQTPVLAPSFCVHMHVGNMLLINGVWLTCWPPLGLGIGRLFCISKFLL